MNWRAHTGVAVRELVWHYLQAIGFFMFVLLVIALTIDLTDNLDGVLKRADELRDPTWLVLLKYLFFRSVDIITRLLSMAALIGGGVATALRHHRMEDIVLDAAGASPSIVLSALCMVGVMMGVVQGSFQNWLRPIVVQQQVEMNLGKLGGWFGETELPKHVWVTSNSQTLRAKITRGSQPKISDVTIFNGVDQPSLGSITFAQHAVPFGKDGQWRLENAVVWTKEGNIENKTSKFEFLEVELPINIERVQWYDVHTYYIPNHALRQIAQLPQLEFSYGAMTTLAVRKAAFFLPAVFALFGTSLAMAGRRGRRLAPFRLLVLATIGYVTVVSVKVLWALGMHGRMEPFLAATTSIWLAFGLSVLLQLQQAGYLSRTK